MNDFHQALCIELATKFNIDLGSLDETTGLFSGGLIDSLSVMDLVGFVERETGRAIPLADITLDNFDSIARIVVYAQTLISAG